MSKKYIDFVPAKKTTKTTAAKTVRLTKPASRTATSKAVTPKAVAPKAVTPRAVAKPAPRTTKTTVRPASKMTKTTVRPTPRTTKTTVGSTLRVVAKSTTDEIRQIKSQRIVGSRANTTTKTAATASFGATELKTAAPRKAVKITDKKVFTPPKPTFINQNKVVKRPLSGNIYRKEIKQAVAEEPKGPVTIISKQENDKHVGVIVTIILTIILGAAAGTVAFLLLPK